MIEEETAKEEETAPEEETMIEEEAMIKEEAAKEETAKEDRQLKFLTPLHREGPGSTKTGVDSVLAESADLRSAISSVKEQGKGRGTSEVRCKVRAHPRREVTINPACSH